MRIEYMREYIAVAETGNITAAAERVYLTQPVLSKHIKALEDELETKLFIRSTHGLTMTPPR